MASERKLAEGLEHVKQAEKCLKTGFLKWKPDLDEAASEYSKAAVAFKNAKATDHAINSYLKCSDVQREMGSHFHAAKSLESAALLLKEVRNGEKAADFVEQAADLYLEHGTPDTAAIALERAAKMLDDLVPDRAVKMYVRACDISEGEDRPQSCAEMIGRAARILMRQRKLDEAASMLKREMDYYELIDNHGVVNKLVMGLVVIHLHRQDFVAADMAYKGALRYTGFAESEEAAPIQQLLDAFDQGDPESANQVLASPLFKFMENEFTKLVRDLRMVGGGGGQHKKKVASSSDGQQEAEEKDDYSEGLL